MSLATGKDLLLSTTTWGTIIGFVDLIATSLGYDIGDKDMLVNGIVGVLSAGLTLWGRFKAVHKITSIAGIKTGTGSGTYSG